MNVVVGGRSGFRAIKPRQRRFGQRPYAQFGYNHDTGPGEMGRAGATTNNNTGVLQERSSTSGMVGAGTDSSAPSSSGNVGPGTNNSSGKQPGGR
jgi:hypothetical protein